ncbi:alpha-beta hydrolase superfamily lysophospholipase [Micromonospora pisi]|uniref:Alpha-beta hydrolase superfamily lysophospholipase n=1 Tax=Micromonospora pisi TaxID=589240 RepID=A0A495JQL1_9ACTN|nr:alpha/beta fold hydrolase [Micromonospora pisi]RKR91266.1 alpha-beta hydrolase superfamily lysophospholipase [Micromonospora pisi]
MEIEKLQVDGVFVEHAAPVGEPIAPPIVMVHGGSHGSWVWDKFLPYFAATGRHCYSFSWFNHNGSRALPEEEFVRRSIQDVTEELKIVVSHVGQTPVLMAHSMGAMAVQKYAEDHPVVAQVLIAPIACKEVGNEVMQLPIDLTRPYPPMPYEMAREWFFEGLPEDEARHYYALMPDESPTALWEVASGGALSLERTRIGGPSLMVGAEHDIVVPAEVVRRSAAYFGSDYLFLHDRSHSMLLEPGWRETADRVRSWLDRAVW